MPDFASEIKVWPVPEVQGTKPNYNYSQKQSYYTAQRNKEHRAPCDIFAREGADVVSMTDGVVWSIKVGGDWGKQVRIETPLGMTVLYAHLSKQLVTTGQRVTAGQKIGEVGHTGYTKGKTGDHLHPEFWSDRNWLHTIDLSQKLEAVRLEEEEEMAETEALRKLLREFIERTDQREHRHLELAEQANRDRTEMKNYLQKIAEKP